MTRDLGAAVAAAVADAVAAGELPGPVPADGLRTAGTWRPVPPSAGGGPGSYATSVPFTLAVRTGSAPRRVAEVLAERLPRPDLIAQATVTGPGYLSLTVHRAALAGLAVRISQAGPGCARSDALRGRAVTAPRNARLAAAASWPQAARQLTAELTGRLAAAAGADVTWVGAAAPDPPPAGGTSTAPAGESSPVAAAVAFAGEDAIRLALSRRPPGALAAPPDPRAAAARHLGNPAYAVQYAHAHAASALRQAADFGFPEGDAGRFQPCLLAHPRELALLDALSWLPERVAGAARRHEPHVLTAYLENLVSTYLGWQEHCPLAQPGACPPEPGSAGAPEPGRAGGRVRADARGRVPGDAGAWVPGAAGAPPPGERAGDGPGGPRHQARLWLAKAARTTLGAGLGLLGVAAPSRA